MNYEGMPIRQQADKQYLETVKGKFKKYVFLVVHVMTGLRMHRFSLLVLLVLGLGLANGISATAFVEDSVQILPDTDSLLVCTGTSIQLSATDADSYSWTPASDFDNPLAQDVTLTPSTSQWYFLTAMIGGQDCIDSVFVTVVDPTFEVTLSRTDTICPEDRVDAVFSSNAPISSVEWNTTDGVVDPESTDGTAMFPLATTEYIVTATIGNCERSDTFTIDVIPFSLISLTGDTLFLCKPETGTIRLSVSPMVDITWSPDDEFIDPMGTTANVSNEVTMTYTATAMYMGCTLARDIVVKVDSLPTLDLAVIPEKDPYCEGEEIYIIGANVDTSLYPDLEFEWVPDDGQIQDSANTGNVHAILLDTTMFIRYVTNNACVDSSTVTVNVIPQEIPLSVTDTVLCPGEMFQVEVQDPNIMDIEWTPADGLSCTDCYDPIVTVQQNPITYMVSGENMGCPMQASLNVSVKDDYLIPVNPNPITGCAGDMVEIQIDTFGGVEDLSIQFQSGSGQLSCNDCPNPTLTIESDGALFITGTQTDPNFCLAVANVPIAINGEMMVNGGQFTGCVGEPIVIDLTGFGFENPVLSIQGNADLSCTTCLMPEVTLNDNSNANLVVNSDESGPGFCGKITTFLITPGNQDQFNFELSDSMPGQGEIISVTLTTVPPAPGGTQYAWTVNGNSIPDDGATAEVSLSQPGPNVVTVTWINSNGCPQTEMITINALEPEINIPNAFTPNNDDTNDKFRINIIGNIQLTEFVIFNRWGQVVYDNADPEGWDGEFNGEPAPPEVYVYVAKFRFPNGDTQVEKGDVTLIR